MDVTKYLLDLEEKPGALHALADVLHEVDWPPAKVQRVLLTGMGSSWFAADTMARRMRRAGLIAFAEIASVEASLPPSPDLALVAISASGKSAETLELLEAHHGTSFTVALTNTRDLDLPADHTVLMHAGAEDGGVACRSYVHTLVLLALLEHQLTGGIPDLAEKVHRAADAVQHLLDTRDDWLPALAGHAGGPHGTWLIAPAERMGNALQGALMLREGPRRPADGCETGDWNHVDLYLTKSLDYRAVLFTGSRFDGGAAQWMRERRSTWVAVGPTAAHGAAMSIRYPHDDDPLVALFTEVLVPELLGAWWWAGR